jgi:glucuronate isomerase
MLTEMARMSLDDGLVMQIHPGSVRNHNPQLYERYGRDIGADIPQATNYVMRCALAQSLRQRANLTIILFTLDESTYSRELAPLAGHYPCLRLGPPWWFHDSPEGMMRFREQATETAGFYNTVGFNDDTRAFLSIPARHDVARRMDCAFLAKLVTEHRLAEDEAFEVAHDLTYRLVKRLIVCKESDHGEQHRSRHARRRRIIARRASWPCALDHLRHALRRHIHQLHGSPGLSILKPTSPANTASA